MKKGKKSGVFSFGVGKSHLFNCKAKGDVLEGFYLMFVIRNWFIRPKILIFQDIEY